MSRSLRPHGLNSPWNSPGQNTGVGSLSLLLGIFPIQGSNPGLPHLPAEPPRKPKNTGVGSLSLLQRIFLTQEQNRGLLHCRWILYQLSYQGSPHKSQLCITPDYCLSFLPSPISIAVEHEFIFVSLFYHIFRKVRFLSDPAQKKQSQLKKKPESRNISK